MSNVYVENEHPAVGPSLPRTEQHQIDCYDYAVQCALLLEHVCVFVRMCEQERGKK